MELCACANGRDCLQGRVAIVTGGGSGIGFEIARQLGLHGTSLMLMGRRESFLQKAVAALEAEGIRAAFTAGDVRSGEDAQRVLDSTVKLYGHVDTLINAAAGNFLCPAKQLSLRAFRTVMEIDTVGTFNMSRTCFEALKSNEKKDSVILSVSMTLHYGATWFQAHSSAAKAAIDSLTRTLGLEWGKHGIRVVGVAPGPIADTPGMTKLAPGAKAMVEQIMKEAVPLGRMGKTTDIGQAAVFLCSPAASYVNGTNLVVDGGEWLYRPPLVPEEQVEQMARAIEKKSRSMGPKAAL
ncbi:MAG: hypothetical protein MHM6MM_004767 [Cercozoa sp. M6MM]